MPADQEEGCHCAALPEGSAAAVNEQELRRDQCDDVFIGIAWTPRLVPLGEADRSPRPVYDQRGRHEQKLRGLDHPMIDVLKRLKQYHPSSARSRA